MRFATEAAPLASQYVTRLTPQTTSLSRNCIVTAKSVSEKWLLGRASVPTTLPYSQTQSPSAKVLPGMPPSSLAFQPTE